MAIEENIFDGHTLKPHLEQVKELTNGKTKKAIVDRGYIGQQDRIYRGSDAKHPKERELLSYKTTGILMSIQGRHRGIDLTLET